MREPGLLRSDRVLLGHVQLLLQPLRRVRGLSSNDARQNGYIGAYGFAMFVLVLGVGVYNVST